MGTGAIRCFGSIGSKGGSKLLGPIGLALDVIDCGCSIYRYCNAKKVRQMAEADAEYFDQQAKLELKKKKHHIDESIELIEEEGEEYLSEIKTKFDKLLGEKKQSLDKVLDALKDLNSQKLEYMRKEMEQERDNLWLERKQRTAQKMSFQQLEQIEKEKIQKLIIDLTPVISALNVIIENYKVIDEDYTEFDSLFEKYRKVSREFLKLCNKSV